MDDFERDYEPEGDIYAGTDTSDRGFWEERPEHDQDTTLDFSRCPCCGAVEDFAISTDESLYATTGLALTVGADGSLQAVKEESVDVFWKSAKVVGYMADCCGESLPDAYQDELDRVMQTERDKDE